MHYTTYLFYGFFCAVSAILHRLCKWPLLQTHELVKIWKEKRKKKNFNWNVESEAKYVERNVNASTPNGLFLPYFGVWLLPCFRNFEHVQVVVGRIVEQWKWCLLSHWTPHFFPRTLRFWCCCCLLFTHPKCVMMFNVSLHLVFYFAPMCDRWWAGASRYAQSINADQFLSCVLHMWCVPAWARLNGCCSRPNLANATLIKW